MGRSLSLRLVLSFSLSLISISLSLSNFLSSFLFQFLSPEILSTLPAAIMTSQDKGRPLPKFGEWDVNNPASAEGFTVIFNKARNDKKTNNGNSAPEKTSKNTKANDNKVQYPPSQRKWFCCR